MNDRALENESIQVFMPLDKKECVSHRTGHDPPSLFHIRSDPHTHYFGGIGNHAIVV